MALALMQQSPAGVRTYMRRTWQQKRVTRSVLSWQRQIIEERRAAHERVKHDLRMQANEQRGLLDS